MQILPVTAGQIPQGVCYGTYQDMLQGFAAALTVQIPNPTQILVSQSTPTADQRQQYAWLKLDSSGNPTRLYWYSQGAWLSPHPLQPGTIQIFMSLYENTDPSGGFPTFDGGDGTTNRSLITGPMWQLAQTNLNGNGTYVLGGAGTSQFPLGVGTMISGTAPNQITTTIQAGQIGGEQLHILTQNEMPPHNHHATVNPNTSFLMQGSEFSGDEIGSGGSQVGNSDVTYFAGGDPSTIAPGSVPNVPTLAAAHNNIPPFCGVYFYQRSARQFYALPG